MLVHSNSRRHTNIVIFPCRSIRIQPTPTPILFPEPSKYRVHKLGSVSYVHKLVELEYTNVQLLKSSNVQFGSTI